MLPFLCDFRKPRGRLLLVAGTSDRVRELLRESGLTQRDFAQKIGLDDSKLSKSLSGHRRLSSLDLARIAELCKVSVDWLITGEETPLAVAARATGGSAGVAVQEARRLCTLRADIAELGWRQPWLPVAASPGSGSWATQGEQLARIALDRFREIGVSLAEPDLAALVERAFGADVAVVDLGHGFDGMATSSDAVKLILLSTSMLPNRQRFTLAHELGHLLAGDDQGVHLDRDVFDAAQRRDPGEKRANAFAAAFLMPEDVLRDAVPSTGLTPDAFAALATDLMVTPAPLAFRLRDLRLIDSGTCDRLRRISAATAANMCGRGEELARRVAESSRPRPPGLLVRDAYAAYESGAATLRPYANLIGVDVDALRSALESETGAYQVS
jgi:Zn-dependent peptidase ImmA (M78 family)/plasmid maintenance system antidote protein VapI